MCQTLGVSSSGYFAWRKEPERRRETKDAELLDAIESVRTRRQKNYGSPRVTKALKDKKVACSRNRVARVMRKNGIRALAAKKYKVTTDSKHDHPVARNVLDRQFNPERKDQVWAADITYIGTEEGWLYLAAVIDLYSRRVIGWSMQERLTQDLVLDAMFMALENRGVVSGLIHHSDRGSQYAAGDFQSLLEGRGIVCSMSRKGNCWDNAVVESFFHTLKVECVYQAHYVTREEARRDIFDYIEIFYNRQRLHSSLGYVSPVSFEATNNLN
jgi:transposase InsO family protein